MSKSRKFLVFCCFVLVDMLLIGGIVLLRDVTLKNVLKREVNALGELSFSKDRYNSKVESHGDYAVVEEAIKAYLDEYAVNVQKVTGIMYDARLDSLLLVGNVEKYGPDFLESLKYIDRYQNIFNNRADKLAYYMDDSDINKYIYKYTDDEEIIKLYKDLVKKNNFDEKLEKSKLDLIVKRVDTNSHIDAVRAVLIFLKDNSGNYNIVNGEINFSNDELYAEYVKLMNNAKRIY